MSVLGTAATTVPFMLPATVMDTAEVAYSFLTYNAHLFGRTGMVEGEETGLVYLDEYRADQIIARLRDVQPDVIGLTEVWDEALAKRIVAGLEDIYPYQVGAPYGGGIQDILTSLELRWPRTARLLRPRVKGMVRHFAQSHYGVPESRFLSGALGLISEDRRFWALKEGFGLPPAWGAGLLLLSKHPITDHHFYPHPVTTGLERFTQKGVLRATVSLDREKEANVFLTHAQEGEYAEAVDARRQQVLQLEDLVEASEYPSVVMGDLNVQAEQIDLKTGLWTMTAQYEWMMERFARLSLLDGFRHLYGEVPERPGYTYDHENELAEKFGVAGADQGQSRIDYIFLAGLRALTSQVLRNPFIADQDDSPLSDHFPLLAQVAFPSPGA